MRRCFKMRYLGGKHRVAKKISWLINRHKPEFYLEPFAGMASVARLIEAKKKVLTDAHPDLILLYQALSSGWVPPATLTREEHAVLKNSKPSALRAFAGFGCSFSGKFFGGYVELQSDIKHRSNPITSAESSQRSLLALIADLPDTIFEQMDYREAFAKYDMADVIYCDPPYAGTTRFSGTEPFDHDIFWSEVRKKASEAVVYVSEYSAP